MVKREAMARKVRILGGRKGVALMAIPEGWITRDLGRGVPQGKVPITEKEKERKENKPLKN